ncbi:MAG: potassium transporter TrkG [Myxococcota bacterium]|nr:potassium transporter TrkG [Myxococcota bacterium]
MDGPPDKSPTQPQIKKRILKWADITEWLAALVTILIEIGMGIFPAVDWASPVLSTATHIIEGIIILSFLTRFGLLWRNRSKSSFRALSLAATIFILLLAGFNMRLAAVLALLHDGFLFLNSRNRTTKDLRYYQLLTRSPARTLVSTFAIVAFTGAILLSLPSSHLRSTVSPLDALFTSVSATCVTGLVTVDTAQVWTPFGLTVITILIQIGGLGIMVFGSALSLSLGQKLKIFERKILEDVFDQNDTAELRGLLKGVLAFTLIIETLGAMALLPSFLETMAWPEALGFALFHSISAFCNAGFALFSDSLVTFQSDPRVNTVIIALFSIGGFGFGVLAGLARMVMSSRRISLSLQAHGVFLTSLALTLGGAVFWFLFEFNGALADKGIGESMLISVFQSATTRTAGFNTVVLGNLQPATAVLMMVLMLIGASPGSTGGGIKTTTILVVALAIRSFAQGRRDVTYRHRAIDLTVVLKALAILGAVLTAFFGGSVLLLWLEPNLPPLKVLFEAASALGTVGLSMGITHELGPGAKLLLCLLMFFGRLGPLTIATAALKNMNTPTSVRFPTGRINVG